MKICPECQTPYSDDIDTCTRDGEQLVPHPEKLSGNPQLAEPSPASPADRTSMIDLEAIEAQRRMREPPPEASQHIDEKTPLPDLPAEQDIDATGTFRTREARARRRMRTLAAVSPAEADALKPVDEALEDDVVLDERTDREAYAEMRSRRSAMADDGDPPDEADAIELRSGNTRTGTQTRTRRNTRTGMTRPNTRVAPAPPKRTVTAAQAGFLAFVVVVVLVGSVVAVARSTAVLTVTTVPPGATVTLDGENIGLSPVQKRVRTGSHTVELSLSGFDDFKEVVAVPAGGLPFLQPLQKKAPPPPPPPTPGEIADDLVRTAAAALAGGDPELAKRKLDEAEQLVPGHSGVAKILPAVTAALDVRMAQLKQSEEAAAREARLRQARVLAREGRALYDKGQIMQAKERLYASLKLDNDNPEPHRTLGRIFNREDQVDKVRYHLQRYLDLGGADADFKVREWLKAHPK